MPITLIASHEFERCPRKARKLAKNGPVFVIEHDVPAYVLLNIDEYRQITLIQRNVAGFAPTGVQILNPWENC